MRLITTLSLSAAALALAGLCASAQPLRTAAANAAAVPTATPATLPIRTSTPEAPATAFSAAPSAKPAAPPTTVAAASPAPASAQPAPAAPENTTDGIAATVGDTSVSDYELDQRVALFFATSGYKPNAEDIKRARKMQMDQLIDEHIQLAEARRRKITVSPVEVDKRIEDIAKRQNASVKDLAEVLAKAGSSIDVLRQQQTVSIAWNKVIYSEFGDSIVVSPAMIDDALHRAAEGANKTHYHVMEIFLPVDSPEQDAEVKKQIDAIDAQIRAGASFRNIAQQYSRNPSAAAGGDIGWIYDGQLDNAITAALSTMHNGELSHPVRGKGGWYLLGLQERQEPLGTAAKVEEPVAPSGPPNTLPLARLLLPLAPNAPPEALQNVMRAAGQIREAAASCDVLEKLSHDPQLKGTIFMALGDVKLSEISEQMRKALADTKSGEVAAPFQSDAGIEIIARCDKRAPPPTVAFKLPSRDDIENDLYQEQISAMARRFMRDLRRDANIQERNDNAVMDAALIQ